MFTDISKVYRVGGLQPAQNTPKTSKSEKSENLPRISSSAPALVRDLQDKVEISDEARAIAKSEGVFGEEKAQKIDTTPVSENWYGAGYLMALNLVDEL